MTTWLAALAAVSAVALWGRASPRLRLAALAGTSSRRARDPKPGEAVLIGGLVGTALAAGGAPLPLVVAAPLVALGAATFHRRRAAARHQQACDAAAIEVTFALAAELRAGRTPAEALRLAATAAGPLAPVLDAAVDATAAADGAARALAAAAATPDGRRLRPAAAAWTVTERFGGHVGLALERVGEAMDDADESARELDAALAGPRATVLVLALLPLVGLALGQSVGAHPLALLVHRPLGWGLLASAATLDAVGVAVMRRITRAVLNAPARSTP